MPNLMTTTAIAAAALALASGLPALADPAAAPALARHHHHRVVVRTHVRRHFAGPSVVVAPEPYGVPLDERGPDRYPNNGGEDELGINDGVGVGREAPVPGPESTGLGLAETSRGRSFEIEGPPIGPSLPVLPYYVDPNVYR